MDCIREATIGQLIRLATRRRVLPYPEELSDFQCPLSYKGTQGDEAAPEPSRLSEESPGPDEDTPEPETASIRVPSPAADEKALERAATGRRQSLARVATGTALQKCVTRAELEQRFSEAYQHEAERSSTETIGPEKLECGTIVVDWYSNHDQANPQNWSLRKKTFVSGILYMYTFDFYLGSAIYAPSSVGLMAEFGVSEQVASLGLSMYVLAYGIGPLLFSPLSEIPSIGRNPPYVLTFAVFTILLVPTALARSAAGFMVLRFVTGFFGSPCLATGGASLGDMFSIVKLPYVLSVWAFAATCGPALGPLLSGFSVVAEGWRWSMWELLWLSGPVWIAVFLFLPETSAANILLRRAQRLRRVSGNPMLKSQGEIDQAALTFSNVAAEALWRPIQTILLDPSIAFTAVYTALIYGIYYSFFEAFPIVYIGFFGFNLGQMGLAFVSIIVGAVVGLAAYCGYIYYMVEPDIRLNGLGAPERRLIPALFAAFLLPVGLFIFAWTSAPNIHWIGPTIGIMIFTIGIFVVIQCIFLYLALTYPQYAASLFAGNDFTRSTLAAATIHFSRPLYVNLGVGPGVSLLAAFTCVCVAGIYALWYWGAWLRTKSRFAAK